MRPAAALLAVLVATGCATRWERTTLAVAAEEIADTDAAAGSRVLRMRERTRVSGPTRGPTVLAEGERLELGEGEWTYGGGGPWIDDPPAALTYEVERDDVAANVGVGVLIGVGVAAFIAAAILTGFGVAGFFD